jgi:hypothetical protein
MKRLLFVTVLVLVFSVAGAQIVKIKFFTIEL